MEYSYKYCQRLLDTRSTFENTKYQDDVRQCLQEKLLAKIQQAAEGMVTCDAFKQIDLDSHESCLAVSFKQLSVDDVSKFIATFKDTTVNYAQLCKLANSLAGHWSQVVNDDLMMFVKKQLKEVFKDGDTATCTIKVSDIIDEIGEIITEIGKVVDTVKGVKDDIVLIIEKAKAIRDDLKTIEETVKGIEDGSIPKLDGLKVIVQKTQAIVANSKIIIDTIKNLGKAKTAAAGQQDNANITRILDDMIKIIDQFDALKGEVYKIIDNVNSIVDTVDAIRDGKTNLFDGLKDIIGQLDLGVDNIYSVIGTAYTLKETAVDLVEAVIKDAEGAVGDLIDGAGEKVDEIIGGVTDGIGGAIGGIGGGIGGIGK